LAAWWYPHNPHQPQFQTSLQKYTHPNPRLIIDFEKAGHGALAMTALPLSNYFLKAKRVCFVAKVVVSKNTIPTNRNSKLLYKNAHNQTHARERKNDQTRSYQQTMNGILEYLIAHKDWLLLVCFSVDAVNTLISFPLIIALGFNFCKSKIRMLHYTCCFY